MLGRVFDGISPVERANALSHGTGLVLSVVGATVLVAGSLRYANPAYTAAVCVYGLALVAMFAASTLYHSAKSPRQKHVFRWLDQACIYVLIAGTYTPFALTALSGRGASLLLAAVWGLGALGAVALAIPAWRSRRVSVPFYMLTGVPAAAVVHVAHPLPSLLGSVGFALLAGGGLCYAVGLIFYLLRIAYAHVVWHVFVLAGGALHFFAVLRYATPH